MLDGRTLKSKAVLSSFGRSLVILCDEVGTSNQVALKCRLSDPLDEGQWDILQKKWEQLREARMLGDDVFKIVDLPKDVVEFFRSRCEKVALKTLFNKVSMDCRSLVVMPWTKHDDSEATHWAEMQQAMWNARILVTTMVGHGASLERVCLCDESWKESVATAIERDGSTLLTHLAAQNLALVDIHRGNVAIQGTWDEPKALFLDVESLSKFGVPIGPLYKVSSVQLQDGEVTAKTDELSLKRLVGVVRGGSTSP